MSQNIPHENHISTDFADLYYLNESKGHVVFHCLQQTLLNVIKFTNFHGEIDIKKLDFI